VASTVGLICLRIFGVTDAEGRRYAENLGIALQLTNILRDLGGDLARGRLYVPLDELARFGCTEDDLRAGRVTAPVRALLEHQARRAREHYDRARAARPDTGRRRLVAAEIMAGIYLALLGRIEQSGFDVFSSPIRLSRVRKASIALSVWARARVGA
jgi:phytoene synthase